MQRFDCLAKECPLWGPHLLEAAAGTGKTFSIEHIVVRLLLEGIDLERILVVTFTRAATRELKARIRTNIQKAFQDNPPWEYLSEYREKQDSFFRLQTALETFDHCQIFTIHGFCYRQLSEFAFEAGLRFILPHPDESKKIPPSLREALSKFWDLSFDDLLCPAQIAKLMKKMGSLKELNKRLLALPRETEDSTPFPLLADRFRALCPSVDEEKIQHEFSLLSPNYKKKKGNFTAQIHALAQKNLAALIEEEGSLFEFLDPTNQKVKTTPVPSSGFFEQARKELFPIIQEASNPKKILALIIKKFNELARAILLEENHFFPDELLVQMKRAVEHPPLREKLSQKYDAVIIDEFQDTDFLQWEIFQNLFPSPPLRALYLVGDPKQSIYRFRGADVYTYFAARDFLGKNHLYHLDTNFRSTPTLIDSMNALFQRKWLPLPKLKEYVPYFPVRAGLQNHSPLADGKGALHWVRSVKPLYLWEYAVLEIERLQKVFASWSSFALLVKDRYQAEQALTLFEKRGIPASARSRVPWGETEAFRRVKELVSKPCRKLVELARENGILAGEKALWEKLFAWEQREGFSLAGLEQFLEELSEEEQVLEAEADAVQVLTIHVSKGLEFDVVFAWGLGFSSPEGNEELDAEKLRQLYVAMTRAKYRLYVPFPLEKGSPIDLFSQQIGEPFDSYLSQIPHATSEEVVESLALREATKAVVSSESVSEEVTESFALEEVAKAVVSSESVSEKTYTVPPCYLQSFTSLSGAGSLTEKRWDFSSSSLDEKSHLFSAAAKPQPALPLGAEVGVAFHQIFEKLFKKGLWRQSEEVMRLVSEELCFSFLSPHAQEIAALIDKTLALQLSPGFCLREATAVYPEMEFLFAQDGHFIKGFIDLVFCVNNTYYLADWKTNWVGEKTLEQIMDEHDYWLQAKLYTQALRRYIPGASFGGAFYFFVREGRYLCWNDT